MKPIQVIVWFVMAFPAEADAQIEEVSLENGVQLTIQESPYHRGVPHSYYDQAMESITHLYPQNEVLVHRRFGTLGKAVYSLVCYRRFATSGKVMVGGMIAVGKASWVFSSEMPTELFADSLVLILEAISQLPSDRAMDSGAWQFPPFAAAP